MFNSIDVFFKDKNRINQINVLFIMLFPLALLVGPFVAEVLMNFLIITFIYDVFKNKKYHVFKNKIFIFFFIFYIYLVINILLSEITEKVFLNIIFYIRFIVFSFAIAEVLNYKKNNILLCFQSIFLTLLIISIDAYVQYIFGKNLSGNIPYRADRISGFFGENLVLGSYLLRFFPLLIALFFLLKFNSTKNYFIYLVCGLLIFAMIFFSGERASFILSLLFVVMMIISIEIKIKNKIIFLIIIPILLSVIVMSNKTLYDRYVNQLLRHTFPVLEKFTTNSSLYKMDKSKKKIFPEHSPMFLTSFNMFLENKFVGFGPKSYRYYCDDERFLVYKGQHFVDNSKIKINTRINNKNFVIKEFLVEEGDEIKKGELLLIYNFTNEKKYYEYYSDISGLIKKINRQDVYINNFPIFEITPKNLPLYNVVKINACTTHPHNIYFQLLAETGAIGFSFILFLLLILIAKVIKFTLYNTSVPIYEKSLIIGFILILFPLSTSGNFFNNWINMISFYPLGFYLYLQRNQNDKFN